MDAKALERPLDPLEHCRRRIAVVGGELRDVCALIPVLGRRLAAPSSLDGGVEAIHLCTGVVVVVLALDLVSGERE